jgi:threonine synthase|tara:strand:+ start:72819 stop:73883 length:1065 start_codon:yes stop_codon:yes gene_type:complete
VAGLNSGFTPLIKADRLGSELGLKELYLKDESVNYPSLSYKDRVVSVAATRAVELGFRVFACASTGNLGNSVSAHAAKLGLECYVFIPNSLESGKILGTTIANAHVIAIDGTYDDVNRLCTQMADRNGWAFANINMRSYYAEGAKTFAFEVAEQLNWAFPRHVVSPVAGGTLLPRIGRGFRELRQIGLVDASLPKIHAAQAAGCAPVIRALKNGDEFPEPVKPDTIAKSIAIGNPADGFQVLETVRETGGSGAMVSDEQIVDAIKLLARTEGIFTEPAGGTTLAATIALVDQGAIPRDESVVLGITGNGYKTADAVADRLTTPVQLGRTLKEFEQYLASQPTEEARKAPILNRA